MLDIQPFFKFTRSMYITRLTVILLVLMIATSLVARNKIKRHRVKNITEAIVELDKVYSKKYKKEIFNMTESEYTTKSHFSIGLWIRYRWELSQGTRLTKYFNDLGIYHPYDMSDIILHCYYRHLHQQDYELSKQIKYIKDKRKKAQNPDVGTERSDRESA